MIHTSYLCPLIVEVGLHNNTLLHCVFIKLDTGLKVQAAFNIELHNNWNSPLEATVVPLLLSYISIPDEIL